MYSLTVTLTDTQKQKNKQTHRRNWISYLHHHRRHGHRWRRYPLSSIKGQGSDRPRYHVHARWAAFCAFSLKTPIHHPKIVFLGGIWGIDLEFQSRAICRHDLHTVTHCNIARSKVRVDRTNGRITEHTRPIDLRLFHTACGAVRHRIRCERTFNTYYS